MVEIIILCFLIHDIKLNVFNQGTFIFLKLNSGYIIPDPIVMLCYKHADTHFTVYFSIVSRTVYI